MGSIYSEVDDKSGGSKGTTNMYVRLYPNTPNQDENVTGDTHVTRALEYAGEQLLDAESIDYYEVQRFHASDYDYPDMKTSSRSDLSDIVDWLKDGSNDGNDTGENLHDKPGAHLLVHGGDCSLDTAGGEAFAEDCGEMAFDTGWASWTGTCDIWELRQSSAIQEALHQFIQYDDPGVMDLTHGSSKGSEHNLGRRVDATDNITPMLTYHGGRYENYEPQGDCKADDDEYSLYTQSLTWCTKKAVDHSSDCTNN